MPYIPPSQRSVFDGHIDAMSVPTNAGELNYILSRVARRYVYTNGRSYSVMNDVMGAIDGCGREFYRRIVEPYEDEKIQTNGDLP